MNSRCCLLSTSVKLCILVKVSFKPVTLWITSFWIKSIKKKIWEWLLIATSKFQTNVYKHMERRTRSYEWLIEQYSSSPRILCSICIWHWYDPCWSIALPHGRPNISIQYNTIQKRRLIDRHRQKTVTRAIWQKNSSLWLSVAFSKQIRFKLSFEQRHWIVWFNVKWQTVPCRQTQMHVPGSGR